VVPTVVETPTAAPQPTVAQEPSPALTELQPTPVPAAPIIAAIAAPEPPAPEPPAVKEGDLVELGGDVVPPEPIYSPNPTYPPLAARQRISGTVSLDVLVGENGTVQDIKVLSGIKPDFGLDAAAAAAVRTWRFKPATKGGVRVKVRITQRIRFKL
jgi:protein TonB